MNPSYYTTVKSKNTAFLKKGVAICISYFRKRPFSQITIRNLVLIFRLSRFFNLRTATFFQSIEKAGLHYKSGCFGGDGGVLGYRHTNRMI